MEDMLEENMWLAYICALFGPFVQEDAAVLAAASGSVAKMVNTPLIFLMVSIGLIVSDLWKFWIGKAAIRNDWARQQAEKPRVQAMKSQVTGNLGKSIILGRFVPGVRIPLYIAAGFFGVSFARFAFFIIVSALVYIALAFALFHALGAVAGEATRFVLPIVALSIFVTLISLQTMRRKKS